MIEHESETDLNVELSASWGCLALIALAAVVGLVWWLS